MRLNAYLARAGIASRRGSDDLIKEGRVKVNDEPGQLNTYVHAGDLFIRVNVGGRIRHGVIQYRCLVGRVKNDWRYASDIQTNGICQCAALRCG